MAGSQLNQLKGQLRDAGVVRTSTGKGSGGRKRKQQGRRGGADPEARRRKIDEITASHNLFDLKLIKPKFPVAGQHRPNDLPTSLRRSGAPAQSRSRGERLRRETLLPEYESRHRNSTFVDRRFGEGDTGVSAEEKALERFVAERRTRFDDDRDATVGGGSGGRKGKRKVFNLDADDEEGLFDQDEGLTHGGMALDLDADDDDDHLGGFKVRPGRDVDAEDGDEGEERDEGRKRSKAEVMSEVIAKSKMHKHERQQRRDDDDDARIELDEELKNIRTLLGGGGAVAAGKAGVVGSEDEASGSEEEADEDEAEEEGSGGEGGVDRALLAKLVGSPSLAPSSDGEDTVEGDDYDRYVRELAFEKRAKPTDRLKTATERAAEEAERLRKLEEGRIKRMRGEVGDGEEDEDDRAGGKRRRKVAQGDDLEDDFVEDDDFSFGQGLRPDGAFAGILQDEDVLFAEEESEESDDEESEEEDIDLDELEGDSEGDDAGPTQALVEPAKPTKPKRTTGFELAYTYPCPSSHAELLSILASAGAGPSDVATVIDRIRVLHHPSLSPDNNAKLALLGGILLDHIIHLSSTASFDAINALVPHLASLTTSYAQDLARHFVSKLVLMQRNLVRGLVSQASKDPAAKTFPGLAELVVLRLVGAIWSSSDFSHPVCAPAVLLVEQYLGQARVRHLADLASAVCLCTIVVQYESMSKRLVPEAINFLANALALLLPDGLGAAKGADWPMQEIAREGTARSFFRVPSTTSRTPQALALRRMLELGSVPVSVDDQADEKVDLLDAVLSLVDNFAGLYASLDGFLELFAPLHRLLSGAGPVPQTLAGRLGSTRDGLEKRLRFARQARRPLTLQRHRAIPIASLAPAFDDGDPTKRKWDPDSDRAEASKLRSLLKKEKKGAVRELRKDNRFLAAQKAREKADEDKAYKAKIGRITAGLNEERVEEKKLKLQKMRLDRADRKRAGPSSSSSKR